ncbi:hypothetical protein [Hansschlegelia sp. KR7-227]|jgi:predicted lipoprotein with Yx(FWY)xxD motif|uniref:COG4315 family predicted lipoprotein n=1 Tax=Hansschlegelia sp. KR7-227 TaxID=3400914 RepID=UPI003C060EFD
MLKTFSRMALAALFAGLASTAVLAAEPAMTADSAKGKILTDHKGMALYTFDKDSQGKSACNGKCAENWPPLAATSSDTAAGAWTVVTRDDGGKQWAYKGKPLYAFVKDAKPGDVVGDGFMNGVWHVAKP